MHSYILPNGIVINHQRIVDAVLEEEDYPHTYLDTITGALIEIPSRQSLGLWIDDNNKNNKRFLLIERFNDIDRIKYAEDFIASVLVNELSAKKIREARTVLVSGGCEAFEDFLITKTDDWLIGWEIYLGEAAFEYVRDWLLQNPVIKITEQFTGCGDCAICSTMREKSNPDIEKLMTAFQTEQFMNTFANNFSKQYPQGILSTLDTVKTQPSPKTVLKNKATQKVKAIPTIKQNRLTHEVMVIKITLQFTSPVIWRRIEVPSTYTFFELHVAIQNAMGWNDSHLHAFTLVPKDGVKPAHRYANHVRIEFPHPDNNEIDSVSQSYDERMESIEQWLVAKPHSCIYEYDFGDGWEHQIVCEKVHPAEVGINYPQCSAGKNACFCVIVNIFFEFDRLKDILADPKHEEHNDYVSWLSLDSAAEFDPTEFNPKDVHFDDPKEVLKAYEKSLDL